MRIRSRQRDRHHSSGGPFRNTIPEFLRPCRPASHGQSDRDGARAENCSRHRPPLSGPRSFLDNLPGARRGDAAESYRACAGNTSCLWSFLSDFLDRSPCSNESHHPVATQFLRLVCATSHQRENSLSLRTVIERVKPPDFIETTNRIESVEVTGVVCGKLARLEITATQIGVAKCLGTLPRKKVKTQPAAIRRRDALSFSEKGNKQQQNHIS